MPRSPKIPIRILSGCLFALILSMIVAPVCRAEPIRKRVVVLEVRIANDIGVRNAGPIATAWLIDSIAEVAPDVRVTPGRQASKLARLRLPSKVEDISPSAARTLMKSIDTTHVLGGEIFIWHGKYGVSLRMIELPDTDRVRVEREWAGSVEDIPDKIEGLALLLFSQPGKSGGLKDSRGAPERLEKEAEPGLKARNLLLLKKHPEMVYVPGGAFIIGNDNDSDADSISVDPARREGVSRLVLLAAEKPARTIRLKPFLIDRYEVTNAEFAAFRHSHEYAPEKADHPVTGISWHDAGAYAESVGKRLPTEEEWEMAARGTDGRKWPWGNIFGRNLLNLGTATTPVGSFLGDRSPYGVFDMAGNVQEWTASPFVAYPGNNSESVVFDPKKKAVRGSYYGGNDFLARCSMRFCALPGEPGKRPQGQNYEYIGFRCAMDAD